LTILDAYALVALLLDEPAADDVERLLREDRCAITTVNLAEALDIGMRRHGAPREVIASALDPLLGDTVAVLDQPEPHAWRAAELRARHYDRTTAPLSLADCMLLAAATDDDRIATADSPVADAARSEGIRLASLPDSTGVRP
jgi:PIN domain nuclease of toxin-antitoxin system